MIIYMYEFSAFAGGVIIEGWLLSAWNASHAFNIYLWLPIRKSYLW